jgi:acyl-CoA thioester hydrolase
MPDFRFNYPIEVRFSDTDAMGHVNNAVYLTYFEQARLAYWRELWRRVR